MSSGYLADGTNGEASRGVVNSHGGEKTTGEGDEEIVGMSLAVTVGSDGGNSMEPEILDPAILALSVEGRTSHHRPYQYTKERLLELRDAPLSRRRPECLDPQHNNAQGLWDPERWHHDWKRSETPCENGPKNDQIPENHKRRSGDPRERIRKEQDGIVLSPQRRSFNSGCFVPVTQPPTRSGRPDSPLGNKGDQHLGHREISQGARRIGSGRIIARDVSWDYRPDKGDLDGPEYGFGRSGPGSGPGRDRKDTERDRDDRYDRRSFGRDFERDRDRDKDRHMTRNGRYDNRRRISSDSKDDEPEWFSGGPTSQADTIELRGFEDVESDRSVQSTGSRKKQSPAQKKRNKERAITKSNNDSVNSGKEESPKGPGARSTPTPSEGPTSQCGPGPHSPIQEEQSGTSASEQDDKSDVPTDLSSTSVAEIQPSGPPPPMDFNLDDFLKMDAIPELLTNGNGTEVGSSVGSRFSRWFNKESSPVHRENDSRRSSLQDEHLVNNIINGLGDSDTYFAPISPAAATSSGSLGPSAGAKPVTLLEMLQRGKQQQAMLHKQPNPADVPPVLKNMDLPGKVLRIDELEARMMQGPERSQEGPIGGPPCPNINRNKPDEDMSAFKRLDLEMFLLPSEIRELTREKLNKLLILKKLNPMLAQVSGGQAVPASNGPLPHKPNLNTNMQGLSILQMLSKSQQEDARAAAQHHLLGPPSPGAPGPHVPNDFVMKLAQVQQHTQRQQQQQQQQQHQQQAEMLSKLINSGNTTAHRQFANIQHPSDLQQGLGISGRELLQRPEAVAILQGLKRGDITPQHLIQQLAQNPAMQPRHRELLMMILKQNQNVNMGPSPRVLSPIPPQHMLFQQQQQQQQQQLRVSPLPPAAFCVSPILATSPNTLTVHHPGMQQRIPSPRELQAHTQGIMQRALIKKKLEEQQENFRKKQEMQQRSVSPVVSSGATTNTNVSVASTGNPTQTTPNQAAGPGTRGSPAKCVSSPTPLAFTPTSVLRKMTAEKEGELIPKDTNKNPTNENIKPSSQPQGRAVTGMRQVVQSQQPVQPLQQQNWNMQAQQLNQLKSQSQPPVGRPIVKGNNNFQFMQQSQQQQQQQPDFQQQLQMQHQRNLFQQQRAKMGQQPQFNLPNRGGLMPQQMGMNLQQIQQHSRSRHPWISGQLYNDRGMPITGRGIQLGRGSPNDGDLSPTSDQLARWFSPELLARAREGKLPALPDMPTVNLSQNALSLEEVERIQQNTAPVHN